MEGQALRPRTPSEAENVLPDVSALVGREAEHERIEAFLDAVVTGRHSSRASDRSSSLRPSLQPRPPPSSRCNPRAACYTVR
jgi:hypothetical protein